VDKSLKGFYQHINCPGKTLDKCYGSVSEAYKATPPPPAPSWFCWAPWHFTSPSIPTSCEKVRGRRDIKQWTADSIKELQGCFETTD